MNKWEYRELISNIRLLEMQFKRVILNKNYLMIQKPSFIEFKKKKEWLERKSLLLEEENNIINSLNIAYTKLEKLLP